MRALRCQGGREAWRRLERRRGTKEERDGVRAVKASRGQGGVEATEDAGDQGGEGWSESLEVSRGQGGVEATREEEGDQGG